MPANNAMPVKFSSVLLTGDDLDTIETELVPLFARPAPRLAGWLGQFVEAERQRRTDDLFGQADPAAFPGIRCADWPGDDLAAALVLLTTALAGGLSHPMLSALCAALLRPLATVAAARLMSDLNPR